MNQISAAMSTHGLLQVVLDHVHHLTPLGVVFFGAKIALKHLAVVVVKWLLVLLLPKPLLTRFAPSWLPAKLGVPSLPAARKKSAAKKKKPARKMAKKPAKKMSHR